MLWPRFVDTSSVRCVPEKLKISLFLQLKYPKIRRLKKIWSNSQVWFKSNFHPKKFFHQSDLSFLRNYKISHFPHSWPIPLYIRFQYYVVKIFVQNSRKSFLVGRHAADFHLWPPVSRDVHRILVDRLEIPKPKITKNGHFFESFDVVGWKFVKILLKTGHFFNFWPFFLFITPTWHFMNVSGDDFITQHEISKTQ